ncbi:hypothetical protein DKK68_01220 [Bifidobacterium asteroides]|nr:hypothetical protein DKK68_01220 [Bifidobacterium asteroides]
MPIYEIRNAGYYFRLGTNLFKDDAYKCLTVLSSAHTTRRDAVKQIIMNLRLAEQPADIIDALEENAGNGLSNIAG